MMDFAEEYRMKKKLLLLLAGLLVALLSATAVTAWATSPEFQAHTLQSLDDKKKDVQELTTAATATAIAITLLPGDAATPVAEKLADLSQYLLIVLCAIYLEKYIVTVMGMVTFRILVPLSMLFLICSLFSSSFKRELRSVGLKMLAFGLSLAFVIPVSVMITDVIENTYKSTVETTLQSSEEVLGEISGTGQTVEPVEEEAEEDKNLWEKIKSIPSTVSESASDAVASITRVSEEKLKELETVLNNFMESIAVMIITSCVIPILVLIFFFFILKSVVSGNNPQPVYLVPDGRERGEERPSGKGSRKKRGRSRKAHDVREVHEMNVEDEEDGEDGEE